MGQREPARLKGRTRGAGSDAAEIFDLDAFGADVVVRRVELAGRHAHVLGDVVGCGQQANLFGTDVNGEIALRGHRMEHRVQD